MRLVDGDELLTAFPVDDEPMLTKSCVRMTIRQMPTVDAVPVRHGRWTDKDGGIATCSVCGDRWGVWSVMQYCPHCGARMDGKDGENG